MLKGSSPTFAALRAAILIAALGVGLAGMVPAQSNASDPLERALQAMGGRGALAAVTSYQATGTVSVLGGFPGRFTLTASRPGRRHVAIDIGYLQHERAFDGSAGWERNGSVRELVGRDLERARRWARFLPLVEAIDGTGRWTVGGNGVLLLPAADPGAEIRVELDSATGLPVREILVLPYEEGRVETAVEYADWRRVGRVMLPHRITWSGRDLPYSLVVEQYALDAGSRDAAFRYPHAAHRHEPHEMTLATIPRRVYREPVVTEWQRQWGIPFPPTERWFFDVVVNERYGRWLEPDSARVEYRAGGRVLKSLVFTGEGLARVLKFPVTRFAPQPQIYNFRIEFAEPTTMTPDSVAIAYWARAADGAALSSRLAVAIERRQRARPLLFPVQGRFIIRNGHAPEHLNHVYEWSQHFANDIVCLGPRFELTVEGRPPERNEDYHAFGGCDVVAPDDGVVIFARNDIPDGRVPAEYLQGKDPLWAIGGNIILIDHGGGEYSLLAHNQHGTVRVVTGDRVVRGQPLARMGASGSPGFPHLHYQLQTSPGLFDGDGLPATFANVYAAGSGRLVAVPQAGVYYEAR